MDLPNHVHALPLTAQQGDREIRLHPAAVETRHGLLLFDAGLPGTVDQLADRLADAGFSLADVDSVLVTHQDGDHVGGLAALLERTDARVLAHERAAPIVDGREDPRSGPDRYPPARVDVEFGERLTVHTLAGTARVVPTPGHTPDHVSVHFPDARFLLAADALTADEDGLQGPNEGFTEDLDRALASAGHLADLDIERTLCYHGGFVAEGSDRIAEIADR